MSRIAHVPSIAELPAATGPARCATVEATPRTTVRNARLLSLLVVLEALRETPAAADAQKVQASRPLPL